MTAERSGAMAAPAKDQPHARIETVTPERAAQWLTLNTHNRDLVMSRVAQLAGAIERGEFKLNNDCITFSGNGDGGRLDNGQHRLHAVIKAQKPVRMVVLYNVDPYAQETMDSGRPRSFGSKLKLRGEKYYDELASAIRIAWGYDEVAVIDSRAGSRATHQQLFDYLDANPELREAVGDAYRLRQEFRSPAGSWAGIVFLFRRVSRDSTDSFIDQLVTGSDLSEDSPVFLLRRTLLRQMAMPDERRYGSVLMAALVVKAFNAFCLGQHPRILKFDVQREDFPQIVATEDLPA
jgi:hypothetical protein